MLKKLGFLSVKHLINLGGWITVENHLTYTQTHKTGDFPHPPSPCTAETQNEFYGKGSLNPRDALACGAFKASLPCQVPWVE